MDKTTKWTTFDFSNAIKNAVLSNASNNFLSVKSDKVLFNGFWRNGDKQNICLWLDKATWHDAKTGEGGGCKEFAKTAFNLELREFMTRYGQLPLEKPIQESLRKAPSTPLTKLVSQLWAQLQQKDLHRPDKAAEWLSEQRGFDKPRVHIGSGFSNLDLSDVQLFESQHHRLIAHRVSLGPQLIAPIRGPHTDQVQNLFIRALGNVPKEEKSRLLTGAGGWSEPSGSPRAFGFPHLIHDFPNLVLCEGMADYFAAECLLGNEHKYLPIGAANAAALPKWAQYLVDTKYYGRVILVYQLDINNHGMVAASQTGQLNATNSAKILRTAGIKTELFNWVFFLKMIPGLKIIPRDLADICLDKDNTNQLSNIFTRFISEKAK